MGRGFRLDNGNRSRKTFGVHGPAQMTSFVQGRISPVDSFTAVILPSLSVMMETAFVLVWRITPRDVAVFIRY